MEAGDRITRPRPRRSVAAPRGGAGLLLTPRNCTMLLSWWRQLVKRQARHSDSRSRLTNHSRFFRRVWLEQLEDRTLLSTYQWTGAASANWTDPGNWNLVSGAGSFPNAQGDVAQFIGSYSGPQTVTINAAITVGEVDWGTAK